MGDGDKTWEFDTVIKTSKYYQSSAIFTFLNKRITKNRHDPIVRIENKETIRRINFRHRINLFPHFFCTHFVARMREKQKCASVFCSEPKIKSSTEKKVPS